MAFLDDYNFDNLKNVSEKHVFDELERQLNRYASVHDDPICLCNDCVADMAAIALNLVPPRYKWTILGSIYADDVVNDAGYSRMLRRAVGEAVEKVSKSPSHDIAPTGVPEDVPDGAQTDAQAAQGGAATPR